RGSILHQPSNWLNVVFRVRTAPEKVPEYCASILRASSIGVSKHLMQCHKLFLHRNHNPHHHSFYHQHHSSPQSPLSLQNLPTHDPPSPYPTPRIPNRTTTTTTNPSIDTQTSTEVIDPPPPLLRAKPWRFLGYPAFSAWLASSDDAFVLRRFGVLHARTLLMVQHEIVRLEARLAEEDGVSFQRVRGDGEGDEKKRWGEDGEDGEKGRYKDEEGGGGSK
ncbi:hypothetical protein LTS18_003337, partial [Coniosporium uncinatum]